MTTAERKLWWHLRRLAPARSHFRRQATIGPYLADFACHQLRLVIEINGDTHGHAQQIALDRKRNDFLTSNAYRVLRFWNNEVFENIDGVLGVIRTAIDERVAYPPPPTPPRRSASLRGGRGAERLHLDVGMTSKTEFAGQEREACPLGPHVQRGGEGSGVGER